LRRHIVQLFSVIACLLGLQFCLINFLPAPVGAEYWVRQLIIVKRWLAGALPSPRIVFLGGSGTLFSIDARAVEAALKTPTMNMGLHGGMRLEWLFALGEKMARPGDTFVLPLEDRYYNCEDDGWNTWQLRNSLAWNRAYFDALDLPSRTWTTFFAADPSLVIDVASSGVGSALFPKLYARRFEALAPDHDIIDEYQSGSLRTNYFAYSAFNIDDRGDMLETTGARYSGDGNPVAQPGKICARPLALLRQFVASMRAKQIRVIVAHAPYLVDRSPPPGWQAAEADFAAAVAGAGAELLDDRQQLFFPRAYFFNTNTHLNSVGREQRTKLAIADLRRLGIGKTAAVTR
jgi:hypothetical protein